MIDDNLEGKEVDSLIRELSSSARRPAAPNPAASQASSNQPVSAPAFTTAASTPPPSAVSATFQAIPPGRVRKTFVSAITLRPLRDRKSFLPELNLPEFSLPELPTVSGISGTRQVAVVRMCVGLGVLLSAAMPYWPYPKACAWWLLLYLFAVAIVVVAGIWSARQTWHLRLGVAHVVALGIVLWGITLAAEETLPRIGYAKAEAVWWCPS